MTAQRRLVARNGRDRRRGSNREVRNNLRGVSLGVHTAEIETSLDLAMARSERCEPFATLAGISGGAWPHLLTAPQNVCFWHKADITIVLSHVRYWG